MLSDIWYFKYAAETPVLLPFRPLWGFSGKQGRQGVGSSDTALIPVMALKFQILLMSLLNAFIFKRTTYFVLCVWVFLPTYMSVYRVHVWCPQRSEEGVRCPSTGILDGREPPHGFWEPNPSPLKEQQVALTTEASLQSLAGVVLRQGRAGYTGSIHGLCHIVS